MYITTFMGCRVYTHFPSINKEKTKTIMKKFLKNKDDHDNDKDNDEGDNYDYNNDNSKFCKTQDNN
jgi:hypothetical protein